MVAYVVVAISAFLVSGLTLFSGFGLGTLLMPILALFFPIDVAVAATAVVHLANNIFKVSLFGKTAEWSVVKRFGLPAIAAAFFGAFLLELFADFEPLTAYNFLGRNAVVTPLKMIMGASILFFGYFELSPRFSVIELDRRWLPAGGIASGFFGGLSGHQGALRSAFLAKAGLNTEQFVGTNAVIGFMVDIARTLIYGIGFFYGKFALTGESGGWGLVLVAIVAAFFGVMLGKRLVKKITIRTVQIITGVLLFVIGIALTSGLI